MRQKSKVGFEGGAFRRSIDDRETEKLINTDFYKI